MVLRRHRTRWIFNKAPPESKRGPQIHNRYFLANFQTYSPGEPRCLTYTTKLCSRIFSRKVEFYWHKKRYRVFVPPFGVLRSNVHGSSMARWKARGRLPISANWTFLLIITVEALWADIGRNRCARKAGGSLSALNLGGKGRPPWTILASEN